MTRPSFPAPALLALLIVTGCGGQSDIPDPQATATMAPPAASRARAELGIPVTNAQAQAAQAKAGVVYDQRESALVVNGTPFTVDTRDREAVRLFFNRIHQEATPPIAWTGSLATGAPGATSAAFKDAVMQRVNWYRAMAGIPAAVKLSAPNSAKAQQAALMMSANNQLSHAPASSWRFHTAEGAQAAGSSNLSLGVMGPSAIDGYIDDPGDGNAAAGHRRWILHPSTRTMGTGDVPATTVDGKSYSAANALWVFDVDNASSRPTVRDDFVAWPPSGFVPYLATYERWSLSYPNADFSKAAVQVTRDGAALSVRLEPVSNGYGENTLVWKMPDIAADGRHARPQADVRYRVTITNVMVAQRARSFDYTVTVFDPTVTTPGSAQPAVTAPAKAATGQSYAASIAAMPNASDYVLSAVRRSALPASGAAPIEAGTWITANNGGHPIIDNGALRFYVDHGDWSKQSATLSKTLYVATSGARAMVTRSMNHAMSGQKFQVQASSDDGSSWRDVYSEPGRGAGPQVTGVVAVPLGEFAGKGIRLRLLFDPAFNSYVGSGTGWAVTNVGFEGVEALADAREYRSATGRFTLSHAQPGSYLLFPRVQLHGLYDTDPGLPGAVLVENGAAVEQPTPVPADPTPPPTTTPDTPVPTDSPRLTGPRASYTISWNGDLLLVVDNAGRDGTQAVRNPQRLDFTDVTLAFDIAGNAGKTYRLYRAAFNRQPDSGGLGFWIRAMDRGVSLEAIAEEFVRSPEFASLYGAAPSHEQVVTALYRNVLHRTPDAAGAAFWLNHLASGVSVARVLVEFSESPENKQQVSAETALGIAFVRP